MIKLRVRDAEGWYSDDDGEYGIHVEINNRTFSLHKYEDVVEMLKDLGLDVEED